MERRRAAAVWVLAWTGIGLALTGGERQDWAYDRLGRWLVGAHAVAAWLGAFFAVRLVATGRRGYLMVLLWLLALLAGASAVWLDGSAIAAITPQSSVAIGRPLLIAVHVMLGALLLWLAAGSLAAPSVGVFLIVALVALVWPFRLWPPSTAQPQQDPAVVAEDAGEADPASGACVGCHRPTDPTHATHSPVGCQACHRGEPRADSAAVAHGRARWMRTEPLLVGDFVQATCVACHAPWGPTSGAAVWARGERLWRDGACAGCHASSTTQLGPDLRRVAGWWSATPRTVTGAAWADAGWPAPAPFVAEAVRDPSSHLEADLSPQARPAHMPAYAYSDDDLRALAVYVLSLRPWRYAATLSGPSEPPVERRDGASLFSSGESACGLCHRLRGAGGELGPPLDKWIGCAPEQLVAVIIDPERSPTVGYPPLHPRDYGVRWSVSDLESVAAFICGTVATPAP